MCAYLCALLSYTAQHEAVVIIFPLYLRTTTIAGDQATLAVTRISAVADEPPRRTDSLASASC